MNTKSHILFLLLISLSIVSGCAGGIQNSSQQPLSERTYSLGTGDFLRITVFNQEQITGEYSVDSNGNIALPLVQDIPARGLTLDELKQNIISALSPKYIRNPKVSVEVIEYRDIYILGEVRSPGRYAFIPNMTIIQAVAVAGGHTYRAQENWAEVTRGVEGNLQTLRSDAKSFVEPGDTIIVKRRWF